MLANACSGDTDVNFDPSPDNDGGDAGSGGSKPNNKGGTGAAAASGSSNTAAGSAQSGSANGGDGNNAGSETGGNASAGSATAGSSSHAGNSAAGMGGVAGTAGSSSGAGGKAGNGGSGGTTAGSGGTTGGNGGTSAGSGGMAGTSGSGGGGNECVAASFGGHSYAFCGVVASATAAYTKCQGLGMAMISIQSMAENTFAIGKQKGSSWLGGTDAVEEGVWQWVSTSVVFWDGAPKGSEIDGTVTGVYNDFLVEQPNDNGADESHENCLALSPTGWNDLACELGTLRAACESTGPVIQPNP